MSMSINWSEKPEWADSVGEVDSCKKRIWMDDNKYQYIDLPMFSFNFGDPIALDLEQVSNRTYLIVNQWLGPEDGLPPVGAEYELKPYWHKVTIIGHHASEEGTRIVFWDHHDRNYRYSHRPDYFRTIKSDKEKWTTAAFQRLPEKEIASFEWNAHAERVIKSVYDSMISGELPIPEAKK